MLIVRANSQLSQRIKSQCNVQLISKAALEARLGASLVGTTLALITSQEGIRIGSSVPVSAGTRRLWNAGNASSSALGCCGFLGDGERRTPAMELDPIARPFYLIPCYLSSSATSNERLRPLAREIQELPPKLRFQPAHKRAAGTECAAAPLLRRAEIFITY